MISADPKRTVQRYEALRRYMDAEVTDGEHFTCQSEQRCRRSLKPGMIFAAGQLSHVGPYYDLYENGVPLRILVVAMDTGRTDELITLDKRREQIAGRVNQPFQSRNPHMRGTTSALRTLLGRLPGLDRDGELIGLSPDDRVHVFDAYAMANLRLCSATLPGKTESKGTNTMSRNCVRHLAMTVEILEPTVIVLQGTQLRPFLDRIVDRSTRLTDELERVSVGGRDAVMATFSHPSYPATKMHWGRLTAAPYLWDTVVPQLQEARSILVGDAEEIVVPEERPQEPAMDRKPMSEDAPGGVDTEAASASPEPADETSPDDPGDTSDGVSTDGGLDDGNRRLARTRNLLVEAARASRTALEAGKSRVDDWLVHRRTGPSRRIRGRRRRDDRSSGAGQEAEPERRTASGPVERIVDSCPSCGHPIRFDGKCGCS